jgi:hypothetical protein
VKRCNSGSSLKELDDESGHQRPDGLEHHVGHDIFGFAFATKPDAQRNGWIEMASGYMTASEDHHHERETDCQRGEGPGAVAHDGAPNG